ncbi:MAG: hypothetical protein JWM21_4698 [Acidobacteria bacterium]|nr:hypothetical protein [Acidobacteriota bacterium]
MEIQRVTSFELLPNSEGLITTGLLAFEIAGTHHQIKSLQVLGRHEEEQANACCPDTSLRRMNR